MTTKNRNLVGTILFLIVVSAVVLHLGSVVEKPMGDVSHDDGLVGGGPVGLWDNQQPTVAKLDPALLTAVREASKDAEAEGITFRVTSGWRSRAYQQKLLDEAVEKYGSPAEARRWVSTPEKSRHVVGKAIDIGPTDAAYWLAQHGSRYGLCQVYVNEVWHYELLTVPGGTCPRMLTDGAS
ncbi:M15 family metallopeptidase [Kineosporia sp. NBRC 101731]|uniref:M15 family metallopeptidase n=1 Tax=Kineosporia sp. NBRC 101731 TaxID=3032199 RepID=UPI0024A42088|nr:M15 family metallopeptidase [Kineosporia sp. NBRC 101731]GLY33798.1 D-alanyl-D-alanine carboxypeptidase [Kineosporia sp. NBRC 101731]